MPNSEVPSVLRAAVADERLLAMMREKITLLDPAAAMYHAERLRATFPASEVGVIGLTGVSIGRWDPVPGGLQRFGRMHIRVDRPGAVEELRFSAINLFLLNATAGENDPLSLSMVGYLLGLPESSQDPARVAVASTLFDLARPNRTGILEWVDDGHYRVREGYAIAPLSQVYRTLPFGNIK